MNEAMRDADLSMQPQHLLTKKEDTARSPLLKPERSHKSGPRGADVEYIMTVRIEIGITASSGISFDRGPCNWSQGYRVLRVLGVLYMCCLLSPRRSVLL
jgi:hypothetical protein